MNAIDEIKDENVRKVAVTLRSSGLASSETEAVRMAMMMTKTSQKVTQNFDEKNKAKANPFLPQQSGKQESQHTDIIYTVRKSSSVQEKPTKTEEKEEFIFGDVSEKETVQKKDIFKVDNEFEEVVVQEVIITKEAPKEAPKTVVIEAMPKTSPSGRPSMFVFGSRQAPQQAPVHENHVQSQAIHPVSPVQQTEAKPQVHVSSQMPSHEPVSNPSPTPVTAAGSAQMAFASLLGSAQKTQQQHQEPKPAVQSSPAQASSLSKPSEPAAAVSHECPRPIAHTPDPRANMMKEANVDLSKMFNVNK